MLIITKRRKIGTICGHPVYAVTKSEMIPIPNSTVQSNMAYSKNENRSFVNSACKCKMSLVLLRRHIMIRVQNYLSSLCILMSFVFQCGCFILFYFILFGRIVCFWASSFDNKRVQPLWR